MEQSPKRSRQGKKPDSLKVVFGWSVNGMMCQGCLLRPGTESQSEDSYCE